jgi:hypothetical protein
VESQIGHNGLAVETLPFRVGRRALPGEPARIDPAELSLRAGETFHLAAHHFVIEDREGRLVVRDLDSAWSPEAAMCLAISRPSGTWPT